jgi:hypothetical protein
MEREKEIEIIDSVMNPDHIGILRQIEYRRLTEICRYFDIVLTKENFAYCISIKATLDGFLTMMYEMADRDESIKDPDGIAFELTALALGLFKKNKLPEKSKVLQKMIEMRDEI